LNVHGVTIGDAVADIVGSIRVTEPPVDPSSANRRFAREAWLRALDRSAVITREGSKIFPTVIADLADKFEAAPALLDDLSSLSFRGLATRANRYSRWALDQKLIAGDVVCLMMANCPDYMAVWIGLTRVGVVVALINTNLVGDSLAHTINIADPRHIVVGADVSGGLLSVRSSIGSGIKIWAHGGAIEDFPRIEDRLEPLDGRPLGAEECPIPSIRAKALLIYTSGTTGMPKAANISHLRIMQWAYWFAGMMDTGPSDRMYNCLPMYHSVGGIVATAATLVGGGSVVLRRGFSASRFWGEVVAWECTLFQYIGELCRYLVDSPPDPLTAAHKLRLCCGNGLRQQVWETFRQRFGIPKILEFYAATEGSFSLYNCEQEAGAIGRIPPFLAHRFHVELVRFDFETDMPLRDENGLCMRCGTDEIGEAIGAIDLAGNGNRFEGYSDAAATDRKILRNVFAAGDAWYRTGDLMRKDAKGFFFFVDRAGDTFRWKGENVSTQEVAEATASCRGVLDAVVYGVAVPGVEGRAGMAAVVATDDFDLDVLYRHLVARLPDYACPIFVRLCRKIDATSTFKPRKQTLIQEGFDPGLTRDPIYFNDRLSQAFAPLTDAVYAELLAKRLRF
jgi:fatty-acyl-CoA synthase